MPLEYPRHKRPYVRRPPQRVLIAGDPSTYDVQAAAKIVERYISSEAKEAAKAAERAARAEEQYQRYQAKRELADAQKAQRRMEREAFRRLQQEAWAYEKNIRQEIKQDIRADKASRKIQAAHEKYVADKENFELNAKHYSNAELYIPEWSDVIRIGPNPKATKAEMREYYQATAEGRPPNLPPDLVASIENKRRKMLAMKNSQIPDAFQKLGRVLTVIDNINDAMVTASYFARVGALIFPPAAPFLLGVSAGLLVGANILNLATWLSPLALPQQLAKKQMSKLLRKFGVKGLLRGLGLPPAVAKYLPSFSEAIQIAQTAADFTGYGLSIGPIYGAIQEAAFRTVHTPISRALGHPLAGLNKWASNGLSAVAEMFGFGQLFDPLDHLYDLVCLWVCLCYLSNPVVQTAMPILMAEQMDSLDVTEPVDDEGNREMMIQEGLDPDQPTHFLWPGAEDVLLIDETQTAFSDLLAYNLQDWIPGLGDPFLMCFAGALLGDCQELLLKLFGGPEARITETLDPSAEALQMIVHYGLIPPVGTDPAEFNGYVQAVALTRLTSGQPLTFWQVFDAYQRRRFPWPIQRLQ